MQNPANMGAARRQIRSIRRMAVQAQKTVQRHVVAMPELRTGTQGTQSGGAMEQAGGAKTRIDDGHPLVSFILAKDLHPLALNAQRGASAGNPCHARREDHAADDRVPAPWPWGYEIG